MVKRSFEGEREWVRTNGGTLVFTIQETKDGTICQVFPVCVHQGMDRANAIRFAAMHLKSIVTILEEQSE